MLANCQNDKPVPNCVTSPSEPVNPGPNAVVGRGLSTGGEETLGEVSRIEGEANEIGYEGWEDGS